MSPQEGQTGKERVRREERKKRKTNKKTERRNRLRDTEAERESYR